MDETGKTQEHAENVQMNEDNDDKKGKSRRVSPDLQTRIKLHDACV